MRSGCVKQWLDQRAGRTSGILRFVQRSAVLRAIWQSVFAPARLARDKAALTFAIRYGWTLIVARWLYYAIIFQFRDYHGGWRPFRPPPFGLTIDAYAFWQRVLALPFGMALMLVLSVSTVAYLRYLRRTAFIWPVLNILGVAYFLPFVLLQPLDQLVIALAGWQVLPVAALHTAALAWESWASARVLSEIHGLSRMERVTVSLLLMCLWIAIAAPLWR